MIHYIKNKRVLFITTKNIDYLRNTQEINLIKKHALSYTVIGSDSRHFLIRLLITYYKLLTTPISYYDTAFIGFAPQLILPFFPFKFKKINIVEDFFISMYDTLCYDRKKVKPHSVFGKCLHYIDEVTLHAANAILCDTNIHGQYFVDEFHASPQKLHTLYLQADRSIYYPMELKKPDKLQNKYVVLYFGSVLPLQGVDIVLQAIDALKDRKDLYFYCIGPIRDKKLQSLKPLAENIEYIDWLPQKELAVYIAQSDLCLAGHFNNSIEKAKRTIPGKAYIYRAMEKPMIVGDNPANHELFVEDMNVTFVEMGNAKALANEILRLSITKKFS